MASMARTRSPFGFGTRSARNALSRWRCGSTAAGSKTWPASSSTSSPGSGVIDAATAEIRSPSMRTSAVVASPSVTPRSSRVMCRVSGGAHPTAGKPLRKRGGTARRSLRQRQSGEIEEEADVFEAEQLAIHADDVDHVVDRSDGHDLLTHRILERGLEAERHLGAVGEPEAREAAVGGEELAELVVPGAGPPVRFLAGGGHVGIQDSNGPVRPGSTGLPNSARWTRSAPLHLLALRMLEPVAPP